MSPWVLANLQPFDHQAYIDDLMCQHPYVPEIFHIWILEWPARAVIGCVWPSLPNLYSRVPCVDDVHRMEGTNWLAPVTPTVCAIPFLYLTLPLVFPPESGGPPESHCSPDTVQDSGCSPGRIWWDCFPTLVPFDSSWNYSIQTSCALF